MLIENKWQPFNDIVLVTWPDSVPFKVEGMLPDGCRRVETVTSFNYIDKIGERGYVSIRIFDVVDEETRLVRNLIADHGPSQPSKHSHKYLACRIREGSLDQHYTTTVVRGIVRAYGLSNVKPEKVDVNLPDWVKGKLRPRYHKMVADWLSDVNNGDYVLHNEHVERQLNNGLLAVRNYGHTGRRVILPMGHSLAYTAVQRAYWRINEKGTLMEFGRNMTVAVSELRGKSRQMIDHRAIYHAGRRMITVGCQRIPFAALEELADREGWPTKDPNGYA